MTVEINVSNVRGISQKLGKTILRKEKRNEENGHSTKIGVRNTSFAVEVQRHFTLFHKLYRRLKRFFWMWKINKDVRSELNIY
jgi:hypothetical protein